MLSSAVERQFEILGEALNRVRRSDPQTADKIPDIHRIIGMRNIIAHEYGSVDGRLVWAAATTHVVALETVLSGFLQDAQRPEERLWGEPSAGAWTIRVCGPQRSTCSLRTMRSTHPSAGMMRCRHLSSARACAAQSGPSRSTPFYRGAPSDASPETCRGLIVRVDSALCVCAPGGCVNEVRRCRRPWSIADPPTRGSLSWRPPGTQ